MIQKGTTPPLVPSLSSASAIAAPQTIDPNKPRVGATERHRDIPKAQVMIDLTISSDEEEVVECENPAVNTAITVPERYVGEALTSVYKLAPSWFDGRHGDGWERIAWRRRGRVVT